MAGRITPEQFVDLNEKIGGLDIAGNYQAAAHRRGSRASSGCIGRDVITYGRELGKYPIIDARTNDNHEMHNNSEWMFTRFRLLRTNGNAANQIQWWEQSNVVNPVGNVSRPSAIVALKVFNLMDRWLTAIEADRSSAPARDESNAQQTAGAFRCVLRRRPDVRMAGRDPHAKSGSRILVFSRMAAGGPTTNDVLKCQLKPLNRADYNVGVHGCPVGAAARKLSRRASAIIRSPALCSSSSDRSVADVRRGSRRNAARPTTDGALKC